MGNNTLKGVLLVGLGATSYGMLATFVKLAYSEGYTTAEVTASQFIFGILGMLCVGVFHQMRNGKTEDPTRKEILGRVVKSMISYKPKIDIKKYNFKGFYMIFKLF